MHLKKTILTHHDVIKYCALYGEKEMTSDVEKINNKYDIFWKRGESMEQILHVVEPQYMADVLFPHSDEQLEKVTLGILEDYWGIQKRDKETHFP